MGEATERRNLLGQRIGSELVNWQVCQWPAAQNFNGHFCRLEPLDAQVHGASLHQAYAEAGDARDWTYMAYGPFASAAAYVDWCKSVAGRADPLFYAIVESRTARPLGVASYLRISPDIGVLEVGHIHYAPALQGTAAATEAMYLMMRYAIDELAYRRYEWKCDALNTRSRRAAERLGFCFEGIFRQHTMYKGRNRDTAWYSIIDSQWPALKANMLRWLDPKNFDAEGRQRSQLRVK